MESNLQYNQVRDPEGSGHTGWKSARPVGKAENKDSIFTKRWNPYLNQNVFIFRIAKTTAYLMIFLNAEPKIKYPVFPAIVPSFCPHKNGQSS